MQVYKENSIDARSFPEIWAALSVDEKEELVYELLKSRCCTTRTAIRQWGRAVRRPANILTQETVAKAIHKVLGIRVHRTTLFPRS